MALIVCGSHCSRGLPQSPRSVRGQIVNGYEWAIVAGWAACFAVVWALIIRLWWEGR